MQHNGTRASLPNADVGEDAADSKTGGNDMGQVRKERRVVDRPDDPGWHCQVLVDRCEVDGYAGDILPRGPGRAPRSVGRDPRAACRDRPARASVRAALRRRPAPRRSACGPRPAPWRLEGYRSSPDGELSASARTIARLADICVSIPTRGSSSYASARACRSLRATACGPAARAYCSAAYGCCSSFRAAGVSPP